MDLPPYVTIKPLNWNRDLNLPVLHLGFRNITMRTDRFSYVRRKDGTWYATSRTPDLLYIPVSDSTINAMWHDHTIYKEVEYSIDERELRAAASLSLVRDLYDCEDLYAYEDTDGFLTAGYTWDLLYIEGQRLLLIFTTLDIDNL